MNKPLIIDVGFHRGRDSDYYLQKGFDVVAIEANPALVADAKKNFESALADKHLILHDVAIAEYEGSIDFYINHEKDEWSTTSTDFVSRNENIGTNNSLTQVQCATFQSILRRYKTPYYIKIDIEGADILCLKALMDVDEKPNYISIEAGLNAFDETFTELSLLWNLGYKRFKIVNQALNRKVKCPNPAREGRYVDFKFDGTCSGPFGEEAPGHWMTVEETLARYQKILTEQKYFGANGKYYKSVWHKLYKLIAKEPIGWYDIHAKLGSG